MHEFYESPLCGRYADEEMRRIFSDDRKFSTWRRLWLALAESEQALGLPITDGQLDEMRAHLFDIDYEAAAQHEKDVRHDVMAHVLTYGEACPTARGIIHLGATSCYVGDNTDVLRMREGLLLIRKLLVSAIAELAKFAEEYKALPALAWTHFQAAQPTTVGKRACMWLQDLTMDLDRLDFELSRLKLLGCKGTTGTGASFMSLFEGDAEKVKKLEMLIAEKMGFAACLPISGQTYTRKVDSFVLNVLAGIAQSASKFANDMRLLVHLKEMDEPFEAGQVGSSAMAYKRNPMRSERICSLSRYILNDVKNAADTAAVQWLERTLDDSANRRISIPEAFLATDAILTLMINIISACRVYPNVMKKHLTEEMPFIATENILMHAVSLGGDRQALHEAIRQYSIETASRIKLEGGDNDLLDKIKADPRFKLDDAALEEILDIRKFIGIAPQQAKEFVAAVRPILEENRDLLGVDAQVNV